MKKNDIILLIALILIASVATLILAIALNNGSDSLTVRVNGNEYATLSLSKDTELVIESENGTNLLVISGGEAYMKEASCPDKVCVRSGKLTSLEPIVCLPNGVVVSLEEAN